MSRIKRSGLILLCLCLLPAAALSESVNLLSSELIQAETANYQTSLLEKGTYRQIYSVAAAEYYPHTYHLRFETDGAKFNEYLVKRGDEVRKGDALASFTLETDEVALTSQRMALKQAQDALEDQILEREEALEALQEALVNAQSQYERQLLTLRIARAELATEQYVYQQERAIRALEDSIAEMEEKKAGNVLVAPVDGVVQDTAYMRAGDRISSSQVMVTLYRTDDMLLRIENPNGYFRYGMDVTVEMGAANEREEFSGRVVGADTLVPSAQKRGYAYVRLDALDGDTKLRKPNVYGTSSYLEGVDLLPRRAVGLEGGKYYVTLLNNGVTGKRYVNCIINNNAQQAWIVQGLEPGDEIVVD